MKIWRVNIILKDKGNPPYTDEYIRMEFERMFEMNAHDAEMHVMDVRECIPDTFQPLVPKERIERPSDESRKA